MCFKKQKFGVQAANSVYPLNLDFKHFLASKMSVEEEESNRLMN